MMSRRPRGARADSGPATPTRVRDLVAPGPGPGGAKAHHGGMTPAAPATPRGQARGHSSQQETEMKQQAKAGQHGCVHHWLMDSPKQATVHARCKKCGLIRRFFDAYERAAIQKCVSLRGAGGAPDEGRAGS